MNVAVLGGLRLSLALDLYCLIEVGSGEAETSVMGRGDLGRDENSPENTSRPRAGSGEVELW